MFVRITLFIKMYILVRLINIDDLTLQQELLARQIYEYGSHARMNKRKHTFDNEARIHTSTVTTLLPQDDEDGESGMTIALFCLILVFCFSLIQ